MSLLILLNRLSAEMMDAMRAYLPDEDVEEFDKDMEWLFKGISEEKSHSL